MRAPDGPACREAGGGRGWEGPSEGNSQTQSPRGCVCRTQVSVEQSLGPHLLGLLSQGSFSASSALLGLVLGKGSLFWQREKTSACVPPRAQKHYLSSAHAHRAASVPTCRLTRPAQGTHVSHRQTHKHMHLPALRQTFRCEHTYTHS